MHAMRWSPLWTFAAGCLSGAVIIGWRLEVRQSAPQSPPAQTISEAAPLPLTAPPQTAPTAPAAPNASASPSPSSVASAEPSEEPSGDSVAEVLARLEAQYREHSAKAPAPAPPSSAEAVAEQARTPPPTPAPKVEEAAPKNEQAPVLVAVAPKTSLTEAAPREEAKPAPAPPPAPPEEPAPVALAQNVSEALTEGAAQQHLTNQLQQVTALQQAALVQQAALAQQFAVLQYLQLYSLSLDPRATTPARTPRAPVSHRIVDTLPSSFSASDNPWGFVYPTPVLLR